MNSFRLAMLKFFAGNGLPIVTLSKWNNNKIPGEQTCSQMCTALQRIIYKCKSYCPTQQPYLFFTSCFYSLLVARDAFLNVDTKEKNRKPTPSFVRCVYKLQWQKLMAFPATRYFPWQYTSKEIYTVFSQMFFFFFQHARPYPHFSIWHLFNWVAEKENVEHCVQEKKENNEASSLIKSLADIQLAIASFQKTSASLKNKPTRRASGKTFSITFENRGVEWRIAKTFLFFVLFFFLSRFVFFLNKETKHFCVHYQHISVKRCYAD